MSSAGVRSLDSVPRVASDMDVLSLLREYAIKGLQRMYRPEDCQFVFCLRKTNRGIVPEGTSRRYTSIALIGLAGETPETQFAATHGDGTKKVCGQLIKEVGSMQNLGDVALLLWAAKAVGFDDRQKALDRLLSLGPADRSYPTVEIAWALSALCVDDDPATRGLRDRLVQRLTGSLGRRSFLFPHALGEEAGGLRSHVSCFADMVYPIHALSLYHRDSGNAEALDAASKSAKRICSLQGKEGQWWWHYDWRTGEVIERYPVYAIHQDAMAPMALLALQEASGIDFSREIQKGLSWLEHSLELGGASLIDPEAGIIWRKVARREPGKLTRYLQASASRLHPAIRFPLVDTLFPPVAVDYEDRPYHLGWFLYAWKGSDRKCG